MAEFNPSNSEVNVFVYREGILSAVGHDLKIKVSDFKIAVNDESSVEAEFRPDSLRVIGSMKNGRVVENEPGPGDKRDIEATIARDILEAGKFSKIWFRSTAVERQDGTLRIRGRLELHGAVRDVQFTVAQIAGRANAKVTLNQPDFNIKPYRAMLGALRIKPEVVVEVSLPVASALSGE